MQRKILFIYTNLRAAHGIAEALVCEQLTRLKARLAAQAAHTKVIFSVLGIILMYLSVSDKSNSCFC